MPILFLLLKIFHVSSREDSQIHIRCYQLIVVHQKFDALKTNILVLRTSDF